MKKFILSVNEIRDLSSNTYCEMFTFKYFLSSEKRGFPNDQKKKFGMRKFYFKKDHVTKKKYTSLSLIAPKTDQTSQN